jgi:hypothetical protein
MFYKTLLESASAAPRWHEIKPCTTPSYTQQRRANARVPTKPLKTRSIAPNIARV